MTIYIDKLIKSLFLFAALVVVAVVVALALALVRGRRASRLLLVVHDLADLHGSIPGVVDGALYRLNICDFNILVLPLVQLLESLLDVFDLLSRQFASELI